MSYSTVASLNNRINQHRNDVRRINRDAAEKFARIAEAKGSPFFEKQSATIESVRSDCIYADSVIAKSDLAYDFESIQRGLQKRLASAPTAESVATLQVLAMIAKPNEAALAAAAQKLSGSPIAMDALSEIAAKAGYAVSGGTSAEIEKASQEVEKARKNALDYCDLLDDPDSWNCFGADRTPKFWAALNSSTRDGDLLSITDATREILENTARGFVGKICSSLDELKAACDGMTAEDVSRLLALQSDALREQWDDDRAAAAKTEAEKAPQGETITADTPDDVARRERMVANAPLSAETKAAQSAAIVDAAQ